MEGHRIPELSVQRSPQSTLKVNKNFTSRLEILDGGTLCKRTTSLKNSLATLEASRGFVQVQ